MDNHPKIGLLTDSTAQRDAVHVAVAPVQSAGILAPGQSVGILDGRAIAGGNIVGVVDPFLEKMVQPGDWFWLFLRPNTVTGVRHDWDHPDFPAPKTVPAIPPGYQSAIDRLKEAIDTEAFLGHPGRSNV